MLSTTFTVVAEIPPNLTLAVKPLKESRLEPVNTIVLSSLRVTVVIEGMLASV